MVYYPLIIAVHIVFAGMWLTSFLSGPVFKSAINTSKNKISEKKFIHYYLLYSNLLGMIASTGILVTGIVLVVLNPGYGFFQMSANHWLATKQIIMVALLVIIGGFLVPTAKQLRLAIGTDLESSSQLSDEAYKNLNKLYKLSTTINVLVLINFLLAVTHYYIG